jgi:hypothetical protein
VRRQRVAGCFSRFANELLLFKNRLPFKDRLPLNGYLHINARLNVNGRFTVHGHVHVNEMTRCMSAMHVSEISGDLS